MTHRVPAQRWLTSDEKLLGEQVSLGPSIVDYKRTKVIPFAAIALATTSGSWPSGDPSSKPASQQRNTMSNNQNSTPENDSKTTTRTISILANPMRRGIRDKDDHLARILSPIHVESLRHSRGNGLRAIPTPGSVQRGQVPLHLADV